MITPMAKAFALFLAAPGSSRRPPPISAGLVIDELDRWTEPEVATVPYLCFCYCRVDRSAAAQLSVR